MSCLPDKRSYAAMGACIARLARTHLVDSCFSPANLEALLAYLIIAPQEALSNIELFGIRQDLGMALVQLNLVPTLAAPPTMAEREKVLVALEQRHRATRVCMRCYSGYAEATSKCCYIPVLVNKRVDALSYSNRCCTARGLFSCLS